MREILFRAKRTDNKEWVEGDLQQDRDLEVSAISGFDYYSSDSGLQREPFWHEVDPKTISEYTGEPDKNGKKIFENDIVYMRCNGLSGYGTVIFRNGCFWIDDKKRNRQYPFSNSNVTYRVNGNIFDNPELLEVKRG